MTENAVKLSDNPGDKPTYCSDCGCISGGLHDCICQLTVDA